jgi:hypothetical protein
VTPHAFAALVGSAALPVLSSPTPRILRSSWTDRLINAIAAIITGIPRTSPTGRLQIPTSSSASGGARTRMETVILFRQ